MQAVRLVKLQAAGKKKKKKRSVLSLPRHLPFHGHTSILGGTSAQWGSLCQPSICFCRRCRQGCTAGHPPPSCTLLLLTALLPLLPLPATPTASGCCRCCSCCRRCCWGSHWYWRWCWCWGCGWGWRWRWCWRQYWHHHPEGAAAGWSGPEIEPAEPVDQGSAGGSPLSASWVAAFQGTMECLMYAGALLLWRREGAVWWGFWLRAGSSRRGTPVPGDLRFVFQEPLWHSSGGGSRAADAKGLDFPSTDEAKPALRGAQRRCGRRRGGEV